MSVRFGVVGSVECAEAWLEALRAAPGAEIVAVSDADARRAAAVAKRYDAAPFDDHRAMLVQAALGSVILAVSPAVAEKLTPLAVERGLPMLLDVPPARSFDDAAARVKLAEQAGAPMLVRTAWRLDPAIQVIMGPEYPLGRVVQSHAQVIAPMPAPLGWRGDRVGAGGGVLLCEAYDEIDLIVSSMGLPADVLAQTVRAGHRSPEPYDAEDSAVVLMRYADGRMAGVTASWGPGPHRRAVRLCGVHAAAEIGPAQVLLDQSAGSDTERHAQTTPLDRTLKDSRTGLIEALISLLEGQTAAASPATRSKLTLRDHLPTLAVIEAAYLSTRTGTPEAPHLVFERAGLPRPS